MSYAEVREKTHEKVLRIIESYTAEDLAKGITMMQMMRDRPDELKDSNALVDALRTLAEQKKITLQRETGLADYREGFIVMGRQENPNGGPG
ncbi:MAG TPA: hypothetical protein VFA68_14510 [Terriglobales bacterium]|nr:hypothetical protein [Terriglobales bacterium]